VIRFCAANDIEHPAVEIIAQDNAVDGRAPRIYRATITSPEPNAHGQRARGARGIFAVGDEARA
jgi:hypothetical protein